MVSALICAVGVIGCEPSRTGTESESDGPSVPDWQAEYEEMVEVLALSEEDAEILLWAFENRDASIAEFMASPEGQALAKEEELLWDAVKGRNLGRVRSLTASASGNRDALRAVMEEADATIRDAIPPDKRIPWDAHRIASTLLEVAAPLDMEYEQEFRIREHAVVCIEAARAADQPEPLPAAYVALEQWTEAAVFTPQQRMAFEDLKKAKPFRTFID